MTQTIDIDIRGQLCPSCLLLTLKELNRGNWLEALGFYLFGDSDATSRVILALFSTATVLLPLLLRRQLGRWGALSKEQLVKALRACSDFTNDGGPAIM